MWAEKELRNLTRLHAAGIRCPKPHLLRMHVLVMDFIGQDGVAALRLKVRIQLHIQVVSQAFSRVEACPTRLMSPIVWYTG